MRRPLLPVLPLATVLLGTGCFTDIFAHGDALLPDSDTSDETSSTTEEPTPTSSSDTGDVTTVDEITSGTSSAAPGTDTGAPANEPPVITLFDGIPDFIGEAGPVLLQLAASADVDTVRLSLDDEVLADGLKPGDFPRKHEFLSAADNGPARRFAVRVEDGEGLTAEAEATVSVLLPVSGADKCVFEDPDRGAVSSVVGALKYTDKAIVAVGWRDTGAGPRMTLWRLDPNTCALLGGGPRTISDWSAVPGFAALTSVGAAIDVDATHNLVVAGNFIVAGEPQSYVALLNPGGSLLWEHAGVAGDEVAGVAAATGQFRDRILVVGSRRTSDNPVLTDGAIWMYQTLGNEVFTAPPTILRAPFTDAEKVEDEDNGLSEWVRAVVIEPDTGNAIAVGERKFKPDVNDPFSRAFIVRIHPLGAVLGAPWTSSADTGFVNDAAQSVAVCGDEIVAGGWTRDKPGDAPLQPMIFWIDADGSSKQQRLDVALAPSQTSGIACDREHKIVSAGTRTAGPSDAQVFMVEGPQGPRTTYEAGVPGDDGASAVACDSRGFCGWGGFRSKDGKPYAVVRVHHP